MCGMPGVWGAPQLWGSCTGFGLGFKSTGGFVAGLGSWFGVVWEPLLEVQSCSVLPTSRRFVSPRVACGGCGELLKADGFECAGSEGAPFCILDPFGPAILNSRKVSWQSNIRYHHFQIIPTNLYLILCRSCHCLVRGFE